MLGGVWVGRVVELTELFGLPILRGPSGRRRRLYLAMVRRPAGTWGVAGVARSWKGAKTMCVHAIGR
jgi:hypothetical protein